MEHIFKPIRFENGKLVWLDVSRIPFEERYVESSDIDRIAQAIKNLEIRGAPAIGVAAALALASVAYNFKGGSVEELVRELEKASEKLSRTRPTAVNLFWALRRVMDKVYSVVDDGCSVDQLRNTVIEEALRIQEEDIEANLRIGKYGSELIRDGDTILTHCNTGSLATAGFGTALGVIRQAWREGKRIRVIATETRPLLQGARLTVWELVRDGIPVRLVTDNMVGYLMMKGAIDKVIVGADRILRSGHVANKIGTYTIAVVANRHSIPFYVAAPVSTIDLESSVENIKIEERDPDEVRRVLGKCLITVPDVDVYNPAFDITPPELVSAIITDKGVIYPPYHVNIPKTLGVK